MDNCKLLFSTQPGQTVRTPDSMELCCPKFERSLHSQKSRSDREFDKAVQNWHWTGNYSGPLVIVLLLSAKDGKWSGAKWSRLQAACLHRFPQLEMVNFDCQEDEFYVVGLALVQAWKFILKMPTEGALLDMVRHAKKVFRRTHPLGYVRHQFCGGCVLEGSGPAIVVPACHSLTSGRGLPPRFEDQIRSARFATWTGENCSGGSLAQDSTMAQEKKALKQRHNSSPN